MRHFIPRLLLTLATSSIVVACTTDDTETDDSDTVDTTDTDTIDTTVTDTDTRDTDVNDTDLLCYVEGVTGTCWECALPEAPGTDSLKALNQCTTASYSTFDNATRIPSATWVPGTPLPAVP